MTCLLFMLSVADSSHVHAFFILKYNHRCFSVLDLFHLLTVQLVFGSLNFDSQFPDLDSTAHLDATPFIRYFSNHLICSARFLNGIGSLKLNRTLFLALFVW